MKFLEFLCKIIFKEVLSFVTNSHNHTCAKIRKFYEQVVGGRVVSCGKWLGVTQVAT